MTESIPFWRKSEADIRRVVGAVRAGADLTPGIWPDPAPVGVDLPFDVDGEAITPTLPMYIRSGTPNSIWHVRKEPILAMHPQVIGHRSRIVTLERLIEYSGGTTPGLPP